MDVDSSQVSIVSNKSFSFPIHLGKILEKAHEACQANPYQFSLLQKNRSIPDREHKQQSKRSTIVHFEGISPEPSSSPERIEYVLYKTYLVPPINKLPLSKSLFVYNFYEIRLKA